MEAKLFPAGVSLVLAGVVMMVLAWLIGVLGHLNLITNYRKHPEQFPDGEGLGRWMGVTLGVGGFSFVAAGVSTMGAAIGPGTMGSWAMVTAAWTLLGSVSGLARYRRR